MNKLLEDTGMEQSKPVTIPINDKTQGNEAQDWMSSIQSINCRQTYDVPEYRGKPEDYRDRTRFDVLVETSIVSSNLQEPKQPYLKAAKSPLRYLNSAKTWDKVLEPG